MSNNDKKPLNDSIEKKIVGDMRDKIKLLKKTEININKIAKLQLDSLNSINYCKKILIDLDKLSRSLNIEESKILKDYITSKNTEADQIRFDLEKTFINEVNRELLKNDMKLEGHVPKLKVGFYTLLLKTDQKKCELFYGPGEEKISDLKLDPTDIVKKIYNHRKKLDSLTEKTNDFLDLLNEAYTRILKTTPSVIGKKANIINVMNQLAFLKQDMKFFKDPKRENFRDYGRIQFSYDLYKYMSTHENKYFIILTPSTRLQAKNRENYLWVPKGENVDDGTIYSTIEIRGE